MQIIRKKVFKKWILGNALLMMLKIILIIGEKKKAKTVTEVFAQLFDQLYKQ